MNCCLWANGCEVAGQASIAPYADCGNGVCSHLRNRSSFSRLRNLGRGDHLSSGLNLKLWTVLDGVVALCSSLPDGRRQVLCLTTPGEVFCPPDRAFSLDMWAEALAPSQLCELDLSSYSETILGNAVLSEELFRIVQRQANCVYAHLITLGRLDGMERVCLFLADMAWRIGEPTLNGWHVHLPLSRDDIADYLGLNAETVSRIFSRVKKAKLADFHSPTDYTVRDIEALQGRAPISTPHGPADCGDEQIGRSF